MKPHHRQIMAGSMLERLNLGQMTPEQSWEVLQYMMHHEDECEILDITHEVLDLLRKWGRQKYAYSINAIRGVEAVRYPTYPQYAACDFRVPKWATLAVVCQEEQDALWDAAEQVGIRHGWDLRLPKRLPQVDDDLKGLDQDLEVAEFTKDMDSWLSELTKGGES